MIPSPDVVAAARAAMAKYKIPASVQIAQYGLESGWGAHMPPNSNNPFGIKALPGQPRSCALTREVVGGQGVVVHAAFRAFASIAEAFDVHAELLATAGAYAAARVRLPDVRGFVDALSRVYATDPNYGRALMAVIDDDRLTRFDA